MCSYHGDNIKPVAAPSTLPFFQTVVLIQFKHQNKDIFLSFDCYKVMFEFWTVAALESFRLYLEMFKLRVCRFRTAEKQLAADSNGMD